MFTKQNMVVTFGEEMGIEVLVKRDASLNFHVLKGCIICVIKDLFKEETD